MAFFESRGAKLHYEVLGTGPAVLMVHGFTNHGLVWAGQLADLLVAGYQVVLTDLAGHGLSQPAVRKQTVPQLASDIIALLDHLKIRRAAVCGLSLGGMIAQVLAADFPERIGAVVIANSSAESSDPGTVKEIDAWIDLFEQADGPLKRLEAVWPKMLNDAYRASPSAAAFKASWRRIVARIPGSSFANVARGLQEFNWSGRLDDIRQPALVIGSEFDRLFPPSICKQLADRIAGAELGIIAGGSHLSSLDSPKPFNELLLKFFTARNW
ncbi:MAG: hypothetical protein BGN87_23285 [Rhizobiales bacterium 65-79]|nr:MAG: hypothetical protein BGN87_23285 [Rhizobiales bacterium 65-79]